MGGETRSCCGVKAGLAELLPDLLDAQAAGGDRPNHKRALASHKSSHRARQNTRGSGRRGIHIRRIEQGRIRWPTGSICLAFTLREEGGYVDDPSDPGGATNMGITLATYRQWSDDPNLGDVQVKDLAPKTATAIYRSLYWNPLRADALPAGVDLSVFDMGVNAGIWRSARLLQQALGFTGDEVDGSIGPETLAAAGRFDPRSLVNNLADRQAAYYRSLADFPTFGTGWLNRTDARRDAALAMIEGKAMVAV